MVVVGRDVGDGRIAKLLNAVQHGGRALLVEGPIGTGRTTALRAIGDRATERGYVVLHATGAAAEQTVQLGVARQLLRRVPPVPGRHATLRAPGGRVALFEYLAADLVASLAEPEALLALVLDDLHFADTASLDFVLFLLRRVPPKQVLIIGAVRSPRIAASEPMDFIADLSRILPVEHARLDLLSPPEVRAKLTARFGTERAGQLTDSAVALSGGSPLLLDALVEDYAHDLGRAREGYARAVVSGVRRGGPAVAGVAAALAVLGETVTSANPSAIEIAYVANMDRDDAVAALDALAQAGLPAEPGFRDSTAREAVRDGINGLRRADMHLAAAKMARETGRSVQVVDHLLAAGNRCRPGQGWAVDTLIEEADRAVLRDEPARAARCLQVARHHGPAGADAALAARLAAVLWRIQPLAALVATEEALRAGVTGHEGREVVRQLVWHGRMVEAASLVNELLNRPGNDPLAVYALQMWAHHRAPGEFPVPPRHGPSDPDCDAGVRPETDRWLQSTALLADALVHGSPNRVVKHAEAVLRDLRHGRASNWAEEAMVLALDVLTGVGRSADAMAIAERLFDDEQPTTAQARIALALAGIAVERGDPAASARWAGDALKILPVPAWGIEVGAPLGMLMEALTDGGKVDEAAQWLVTTVPASMDVGPAGLRYRYGRARFRLATGHTAAALADFMDCERLLEGWGRDPGAAGEADAWRLGAATARLRLGETTAARKLAQELATHSPRRSPRTRGSALRVLAEASPPDRRIGLLTAALEILETSRDIAGQAYALADLGRAYREAREIRMARLTSRRALHLAKVAEITTLVDELALAVGGAETDADRTRAVRSALSDSEQRVAGLAVRGFSNREIGERLYVTPSTVEQHLTRVYRKLGVRGRRDLPPNLWTDISQAS